MRRLLPLLLLAGCSRGEHAHYGAAAFASYDVIVAVDRDARLLRLEAPFEEAEVIAKGVHAKRADTSLILASPDGRRAFVRADNVSYSDGDTVMGGHYDVSPGLVVDMSEFFEQEFGGGYMADIAFPEGSSNPIALYRGSINFEISFEGLMEGTAIAGEWESILYQENATERSGSALVLSSSGIIVNFDGLIARAIPGTGFSVITTSLDANISGFVDGVRDADGRAVFFHEITQTNGTSSIVRLGAESGWQPETIAVLASNYGVGYLSAASGTSAAFIAEQCDYLYCICSLFYVSDDGAGWTTDKLLDFDRYYYESHVLSASGNRVLHGRQVAVLYERDASGAWTTRDILRVGTYGSEGSDQSCAVALGSGSWTGVLALAFVLVLRMRARDPK